MLARKEAIIDKRTIFFTKDEKTSMNPRTPAAAMYREITMSRKDETSTFRPIKLAINRQSVGIGIVVRAAERILASIISLSLIGSNL